MNSLFCHKWTVLDLVGNKTPMYEQTVKRASITLKTLLLHYALTAQFVSLFIDVPYIHK